MASTRLYFSATLVLASAFFVACSDSTGPGEVTVDSIFAELRDAQQSVSTAKGGSGSVMFVGVPILPFSALPAQANCAFNAELVRFVCPTSTRSGITTSLYYQLLDASNHPQSAFDPATTAAIRTVNDVSGTMTTNGPSASTTTIDGHGDHTLSGLLTDTHTLNGSSTTAIETSIDFNGEPFTTSFTMTETTTGLVLPRRGTSERYPQAGSIALALTSNGGSAFDSEVTITFNGTNIATMVISTNGFTQSCQIDLSGKKDPVCVDS